MKSMKINYQLKLDEIIREIEREGKRPSLLLQICCAPCGSYVIEYLSKYFDITLFYYNPNIYPKEEYDKRLEEIEKLLRVAPFAQNVKLIVGEYDAEEWTDFIKGTEQEREGGGRCSLCFDYRLDKTAVLAKELHCDWFCTTLTISPHKNAPLINGIGEQLAEKYGVPFLPSDFKKREGYKRSTVLCEEYGIYRQNYCGCRYSMWFDESI